MAGSYESEEEEQYEVERILSCRVATDGQISYLVRWKGYSDQDTWEPEKNLDNCKDAILKFFGDRDVKPKKSEKYVILHLKEPSPVSPLSMVTLNENENSIGEYSDGNFQALNASSDKSQVREESQILKNLRLTPERRKRMADIDEARKGKVPVKERMSPCREPRIRASKIKKIQNDEKLTKIKSLTKKSTKGSKCKSYLPNETTTAIQQKSTKEKLKDLFLYFVLITALSVMLTGIFFAIVLYDLS